MSSEATFPYFCVVGGICIAVLGIIVRKKLKASESWPKTTGIIVESSVQPEWDRVGSGYQYIVSPKVIFEYQVNGESYRSSHLANIETDTASEDLAQSKASKYHVGQQVEVYYNPRKPDYAVLQTGDPTKGALPFGIMIAGAIISIVGIIWLAVKG